MINNRNLPSDRGTSKFFNKNFFDNIWITHHQKGNAKKVHHEDRIKGTESMLNKFVVRCENCTVEPQGHPLLVTRI